MARFSPEDAHAQVLESMLLREHYTTRGLPGAAIFACGGYMINRIGVVPVLLKAKREVGACARGCVCETVCARNRRRVGGSDERRRAGEGLRREESERGWRERPPLSPPVR